MMNDASVTQSNSNLSPHCPHLTTRWLRRSHDWCWWPCPRISKKSTCTQSLISVQTVPIALLISTLRINYSIARESVKSSGRMHCEEGFGGMSWQIACKISPSVMIFCKREFFEYKACLKSNRVYCTLGKDWQIVCGLPSIWLQYEHPLWVPPIKLSFIIQFDGPLPC